MGMTIPSIEIGLHPATGTGNVDQPSQPTKPQPKPRRSLADLLHSTPDTENQETDATGIFDIRRKIELKNLRDRTSHRLMIE